MTGRLAATLCVWGCLAGAFDAAAATRQAILPDSAVANLGLVRGWIAQAEVGSTRSEITHALVDNGQLFIQTDHALVAAFDAQTGRPLWGEPKKIGNPACPSFPLAANPDLVAIVNGTRLFLLNRYTGDVLWERALDGEPHAGPAISDQRVYVPLRHGMVTAFRIKPITDPNKELGKTRTAEEIKADQAAYTGENLKLSQEYVPPLLCPSAGEIDSAPVILRQTHDFETLAWTSEAGYLYIAQMDRELNQFSMKYRVDMGAASGTQVVAAPAYRPGNPKDVRGQGVVFAAARNGLVFAVGEKTGDNLWQYSHSDPVVLPPVIIGNQLFVIGQLGNMHCLDAATGMRKWVAGDVAQFVAAGKNRVYLADRVGNLQVLSAANGSPLGALAIPGLPIRAVNAHNDRLFLASPTGLLQALHEADLEQPLVYDVPNRTEAVVKSEKAKRPEKADGDEKPKKPAAERPPKKPAADKPPKAAADKPAKKTTPKGKKAKPGADGGNDANPFGQ